MTLSDLGNLLREAKVIGGAVALLVGGGVWFGNWQARHLHEDVLDVQSAVADMQATQAAFEEDEAGFRENVLGEVMENMEARIRRACRDEELATHQQRDLAYRRCYGTHEREVPLDSLVARGYR